MKVSRAIALIFFLFHSFLLSAGDEPRLWNQYIQEIKLNNHWRSTSDVGIRSIQRFGHMDFYQLRSGLVYDLIPEKLNLEAGVLYAHDYYTNRTEWRPHYHVMYVHKTSHYQINFRLRMEERFANSEEGGRQKSWRPRFLGGIRIPLFHTKNDTERKRGLWFGHEQEILWKIQKPDATEFNQYRFIQGLGWTFNKNAELSTNYFLMLGEPMQGVWLRLKFKI